MQRRRWPLPLICYRFRKRSQPGAPVHACVPYLSRLRSWRPRLLLHTLAPCGPVPLPETPSYVCGQLGSMTQEKSICHTFQPTVVNHGSWRNVHVLHPTLPPASLRTHATALSLGNPRCPKALTCGQAALMATGIEWTTAPIAQAMESPNDRDSVIPCVLTTGQGASLSLT